MGLYAKPLHAIREYVQNEVDVEPLPTVVKIRREPRELSIWGDGKGMDENDIDIAKKVGISDKDPADHTGFRGIGIWSGVAIADEILISTKKRGCPKIYYLKIDGAGIRKRVHTNVSLKELLENNVSVAYSRDIPPKEHFTHVQLRRVIAEVRDSEMWSEENMRQYIIEALPLKLDPTWKYSKRVEEELQDNVPDYRVFSVEFQGKPVYRPPYNNNLEAPRFGFLFNDKNRRIGYWWFCINKERGKLDEDEFPRLIFKKKNFTIGDRRSCVSLFNEGERLVSWTTGEIHAIDPGLLPDSERMDFESSAEKEAFMQAIRDQLATPLEESVRKKSYCENLAEAVAEINLLSLQPIKASTGLEKLEKLKQLDSLEKRLASSYRPDWTPAELKKERDSKLEVVRKLKKSFARIRASGFEPQKAVSTEPDQASIPESEISLVEFANKLSLRHQSRAIMEVVETALSQLNDADLRIRIKSTIVKQLTQIIKVK